MTTDEINRWILWSGPRLGIGPSDVRDMPVWDLAALMTLEPGRGDDA